MSIRLPSARPSLAPGAEARFVDEPIPEGLWWGRSRAVIRLVLWGLWTALLIPTQMLLNGLKLPGHRRLPRLYHQGTCVIMGFRIRTRGKRSQDGPVLFLCNHLSYLDIPVLGSILPGSFVAKSEVSGWPVFGVMAKLQDTIFIRRERGAAAEGMREISARLAKGDNLILFPEGTSGDGRAVLPFKSSLLKAAEMSGPEGRPVQVQPVTIAMTHVDRIPAGRALKPFYAWYGDMTLAPHLIAMAGLGVITLRVTFHAPLTLEEAGGRKALAREAEARVSSGMSRSARAITGRA